VTTIAADASYRIDYAYNSLGALHTLTYPVSTSGYRLKLQYDYQYGQLLRIKDFNAPATVFWQANATDARGRPIDENLGGSLKRLRGFDPVTGRIEYIQTRGLPASRRPAAAATPASSSIPPTGHATSRWPATPAPRRPRSTSAASWRSSPVAR
jgi:hypothetical protein